MCEKTDISYPSSDGIHTVYAQEWSPVDLPAKAVVQIIHGMAGYVDRYDAFARYLAENGYIVVGEDHLGHGKTANGDFGYLADEEGADKLTRDIHALQTTTQAQYPALPYFVLGHSLGSFLARHSMVMWPGEASGVILSGTGHLPRPLVSIMKPWLRHEYRKHGAHGFSKASVSLFNRGFRPARTNADWISRDETLVDAYVADPLCNFPLTHGLMNDLASAIDTIIKPTYLSRMHPGTPVYLFSGDRDPVGLNGRGVRKTYRMFRRYGFGDVTMKLYPDGRHEMLNDINRDEVYADVLHWLDDHTVT